MPGQLKIIRGAPVFFLEPLMLWFLGACGVPPLIHLINRMRYRTLPWAAMIFVARAHRASTRMARLKELLILLFRVLALAMIALAFSRPFASGLSTLSFLSPSDHVVILLDRSASMSAAASDGSSMLKSALKTLEGSLGRLGMRGPFTLVESSSPAPIEIESLDAVLRSGLADATGAASSIPEMLAIAHAHILRNRISSCQIWILSDGQSSDWDISSPLWDELDAKFADQRMSCSFFIVQPPPGPAEDKIRIRPESIRRDISNLSRFEISARIESRSRRGLAIPVGVETENGRTSMTVPLHADSTTLRIEAQAPESGGCGWTKIELPSDGTPFDNRLFFAYGEPGPALVGIHCSDPYVERAFRAAMAPDSGDAGKFPVTRISSADFKPESLKVFDVVFSEGVPRNPEAAAAVDEFLRSGRTLFVFQPAELPQDTLRIAPGLAFRQASRAEEGETFSAASFISPSAPLPEDMSELLPFAKFAERCGLDGEHDALLKFADGSCLLAASRSRAGTVYALCARLAKMEGGFISHPVFPLLTKSIVLEASDRKADFRNIEAGPGGAEDDGESVMLDSKTLSRHFVSSGVYSCGGRTVAANPPPGEYDDGRLAPDDFKTLLSGRMGEAGGASAGALFREIWREALLAAMLLLVAEQALCFSFNAGKTELRR